MNSDELALIEGMHDRIRGLSSWHCRIEGYYEGSHRVADLGVAIPRELQRVQTVVSWPSIAVDALEERLDWLGWTNGDGYGLDGVYAANRLATTSCDAHLDALIFGLSFIAVVPDGEGGVVVRPQSPKNCTGVFGPDGQRLEAALVEQPTKDKDVIEAELLLPDVIVQCVCQGGRWVEAGRIPNVLGEVPLVPLVNRRRTSRVDGRSEITRSIRSYTDEAVRTLLGQSVNRDFYAYPQRWVTGVSADEFSQPGWVMSMASIWAVDKDDDGDTPNVGSFPVNSPTPYSDQIRLLAQLMAGEAAVPERYFGFITSNPPSGEALAAEESRLVKRAERRQTSFGLGWLSTGYLAAKALDPGIDRAEFFGDVGLRWRDASTPTRAATADAVTKLVGAGILPADSRTVLEMLGLDDSQVDAVMDHRATSVDPLAALAGAISKQTSE
jgi:hypothetical protein